MSGVVARWSRRDAPAAFMLFGPISGAAMSPARAFGPHFGSGDWSTFWAYVAGPLAGIMAAAVVWRAVEARRKELV
jgi:glycerol uptake facilitator-like aquaporin